jgi:hypothetical protein
MRVPIPIIRDPATHGLPISSYVNEFTHGRETIVL